MREAALGARRLSLAALGIVITAGLGMPAGGVWAQSDASHAIAEKFAAEADKPAKDAEKRAATEAKRKADAAKRRAAEERSKADESEMLANARREAEARRAEIEGERAAEAALEEGREKARLAAEAEEKRAGEVKRQAQVEAERLAAEAAAQAKAAEETREKQRQEAQARERAAALAAAAAEEARRQAEQRAAEAFRKAAEDAQRAEQERATAAAAAIEARRLAEQKAAEDARRAAEARAESERKTAEARAAAEDQAHKDALAVEREAENRRLLERLRTAREAYEQRSAGRPGTVSPDAPTTGGAVAGLGGPQAASPRGEPPASLPQRSATPSPSPMPWQRPPLDQDNREQAAPWNSRGAPDSSPPREQLADSRVTVLLLMEPGSRGIRRHNRTADPVLCTPLGCYISTGAQSAASLMPPRRALGFGRTWGARAGACSNSLGCVFRDVDLGALPAVVQPVDMRVLRHDRREGHLIEAASDCHSVAGRLTCRRPVEAASYIMWVVPEALAARLGPAALEEALHDGLPAAERAALSPGMR